MDLHVTLLMYLYYYARPVVAVAVLALGIAIICTKDRITKLLGIWTAIIGAGALYSSLYQLFIRYISVEVLAKLSIFNTFASMILGIASGLVLFLYVNKRYGVKFYLGIILIAGSQVLALLFRFLVSKLWESGNIADITQFTFLINLSTLIPGLATEIIMLVIFVKNKHKEKELKLLWLAALRPVIDSSIYLVMYLFGFASKDYYTFQDKTSAISLILGISGIVISLLISIYILVKGRKASEDDKLIIVEN